MNEDSHRPPLFESSNRVDPRPASHLETSFQFLNRVAGDYWAQVRRLLQNWLDQVANDGDYRDLRGRLRDDNAMSRSAFLELYLHELFRRAGYTIVIHPHVMGSRRHPDFLIKGHGDAFYVEAVMPGTAKGSHGRDQRRAAFLDTIQQCSNTDFYLSLDHLEVGPNPARGRKARAEIERFLARLDPNEVSYKPDSQVKIHWEDQGWAVEFSVIPASPKHRGRPDHRLIGVYADGEARFADDAPLVRSTLATKSTVYGALDQPLVIAIGTYLLDGDQHLANALYGYDSPRLGEVENLTTESQSRQLASGFFGSVSAWRNQEVSAVLHVNQLQPVHAQHANVTLWPHPASGNVRSLAKWIPTNVISRSAVGLERTAPEIDPSVHFGLPQPWPSGSAFPNTAGK